MTNKVSIQRTSRILKIGFSLFKWPHLYRTYLVTLSYWSFLCFFYNVMIVVQNSNSKLERALILAEAFSFLRFVCTLLIETRSNWFRLDWKLCQPRYESQSMREAYQQIDGSMSDTFQIPGCKKCNLSNYWTIKLPKLTTVQFQIQAKILRPQEMFFQQYKSVNNFLLLMCILKRNH